MAKESPHKGHRNRVRERILAEGLVNFQPHEILEFLLYHTVPQHNTNPMAHRLINTFGSFRQVLEASPEDLMSKGGVSLNTAVFLSSLTDVFAYYEKAKSKAEVLNTPDKLADIFKPYFIGQKKETLVAAFLDSGLKVKQIEIITEGSERGLNFNTKQILKKAIVLEAHSVAIAHNHPVSSSMPSKADMSTTNDLKCQLESFDIRLTDHIIFGSDDIFHFANHSQLSCFVSKGDSQWKK